MAQITPSMTPAAAIAVASASAVAALVSEPPSRSLTIGALVIGWGVSSIIFGMLCLQTWAYFSRYPNDHLWIRSLVASVVTLEVGHQICIGIACWRYLVIDYGSFEAIFLKKTPWSLSSVVALGAFVGAIVKIFLGWRAYKIGKGSILWTGIIWALAITQLGLAIAYPTKASYILIGELTTLKALGSASLSFGAATDIVTALVLCVHLHSMRTGFKKSGNVINRLIILSVETGIVTSAFSIAVLISYQLMPNRFVFIAVYFLVCKLYSISCVATLNTRAYSGKREFDGHAVDKGNLSHTLAIIPSARSRGTPLDAFDGGKDRQSGLQIGIRHEVSVIRDEETPKQAYSSI